MAHSKSSSSMEAAPIGTVHVAENYADRVLIEPNMRVGAARNLGARNARGDILAFIDADTIANRALVRSYHTCVS